MLVRLFLTALAAWFCCGISNAAEVLISDHKNGPVLIMIKGEILPGDSARFASIALFTPTATVVLESPGGSMEDALQIGQAIRHRRYATVVRAEKVCASACAIAWLAGSPRILSRTGFVGFHATYVIRDGRAAETGVWNALVGGYLRDLGLGYEAIGYITSAPPEDMQWLTEADAAKLGIVVDYYRDTYPPSKKKPARIKRKKK